jgi:hypothetical protein
VARGWVVDLARHVNKFGVRKSKNGRICRVDVFIVLVIGTAKSAFATTSVGVSAGKINGSESYAGSLYALELAHENNYLNPGEIGWLTAVSTSYSKDPSTVGMSLGVDQGIGGGTSFGSSYSQTTGTSQGTDDRAYKGQRFQLRGSTWFRENTLRTGLELGHQTTNRQARDFQDTDLKRIQVASDAKGDTVTLRLTHLTTPTTILLGYASRTSTTARPAAVSAGVEGRQYITATRGALHGSFDWYLDMGDTTAETDYGRVSSTTQTVRYFQRLPWDLIASTTTRWHHELEIVRSSASYDIAREHLTETVAIRKRFVDGSWTNDCSEIGLYYSLFKRSEAIGDDITDESVSAIGVQGKVVF